MYIKYLKPYRPEVKTKPRKKNVKRKLKNSFVLKFVKSIIL